MKLVGSTRLSYEQSPTEKSSTGRIQTHVSSHCFKWYLTESYACLGSLLYIVCIRS